jgi:Rrf2 family protein
MILGTTATHALRALAHLAAGGREDATLGRDLAREIGLPPHYLSKILAALARAGLLTASRGTRGGYRLARRPGEIALIEIVEPFEGKRARPGCLLRPDQPCRDDGACSAHGAWSGVKAAYTAFLETTTLEDIQGGDVRGEPSRSVRRGAARARRGSIQRGGPKP